MLRVADVGVSGTSSVGCWRFGGVKPKIPQGRDKCGTARVVQVYEGMCEQYQL